MYVNFSVFSKSGLEPQDLYFLAGIKQVDKEVLEKITGDTFNRLEGLSLLKSIKGKKGDNPVYNIRLSDKGKRLLEDIGTPDVEEEDEKIFEWLKNHYLGLGKEIGNGAKTKRHIRDFRVASGIEKNNLIKVVLDFLAENEERSNKLEYIFYYPKTVYATKFDLEESWLWNHFIKNRERLEKTFEIY